MTRAATAVGWRNYEFRTDLRCRNGHPPGFHPLYIGKSSRPDLRFGQHADQPWRRYASGFVVHPEVYATEAEALAAEEARIRTRLPLANIAHNENNPCRLDFGARPARPARRPRRRVPMSQSLRQRRRPARRRWSRRARRRAWWCGAWLVLAVAGTLWCLLAVHVGLGDSALVGAGGATGLLLAVRRKRGRRR